MTPERLAEIERRHRRDIGSIPQEECLRRGCLTCVLTSALRAAWRERDEVRAALREIVKLSDDHGPGRAIARRALGEGA